MDSETLSVIDGESDRDSLIDLDNVSSTVTDAVRDKDWLKVRSAVELMLAVSVGMSDIVRLYVSVGIRVRDSESVGEPVTSGVSDSDVVRVCGNDSDTESVSGIENVSVEVGTSDSVGVGKSVTEGDSDTEAVNDKDCDVVGVLVSANVDDGDAVLVAVIDRVCEAVALGLSDIVELAVTVSDGEAVTLGL
jgi:hypothetical protein